MVWETLSPEKINIAIQNTLKRDGSLTKEQLKSGLKKEKLGYLELCKAKETEVDTKPSCHPKQELVKSLQGIKRECTT